MKKSTVAQSQSTSSDTVDSHNTALSPQDIEGEGHFTTSAVEINSKCGYEQELNRLDPFIFRYGRTGDSWSYTPCFMQRNSVPLLASTDRVIEYTDNSWLSPRIAGPGEVEIFNGLFARKGRAR